MWEASVMKKADEAAKSALSLPVTRMKLPATGMYSCITKLIFNEWQEVCARNKLHAIIPTVGDYKQKTCLSHDSHRDTVLLNKLRIGHTRLKALFPTLR